MHDNNYGQFQIIRQPVTNFDNTKFNLSVSMTDAEYAGYIRGMFDCGCDNCFSKLQYEETKLFLTENENQQLYAYHLIVQKEIELDKVLTTTEKKAIITQVMDAQLFAEEQIRYSWEEYNLPI